MNKICARCGAESRDEARICVGCGSSNFKLSSKLRRPPLVVPCPACKRLNRAGALNCIKCGTALVGANAMTAPAPLPAAPTRPVARSAEPDAERQVGETVQLPDWVLEPAAPRRSGIWTAATMVAIVVVATAAWFVSSGDATEPDADGDEPALAEPAPADQPAVPPAAASRGAASGDAVPAPEAVPAPVPIVVGGASTPGAAEPARARQARERLDRDSRARAAVEQQRVPDQDRARLEDPAAGQHAVVTQPPPPPPVAAPASQAAQAVPPRTVSQACAGRNIISEQLCQLRECRNPANAGDPICIKFKEIEENNNRRVDR